MRTGPDIADVAVVVADPWQGEGMGRRLLKLLASRASEEGITRFAGTMLADNRVAFRLMRGFAGPMERNVISYGVREVVTRLAA